MDDLAAEISTLPAGAYAVACSGGADSTALLRLLLTRSDLRLVVVHLNHELRGSESEQDAEFVKQLCEQFKLPRVIARRSEIEPTLTDLPQNPSAKYRALRLALFSRVVQSQSLAGVILAHHADDQAETVFLRLLRGAGVLGLQGMMSSQSMGAFHLHRPLLRIRREALRQYLQRVGQAWREDRSNESSDYRRNVVRKMLRQAESLTSELLLLQSQASRWTDLLDRESPATGIELRFHQLEGLPDCVQERFLRRWLIGAGVKPKAITRATCWQLREQCLDAASGQKQNYPGNILLARIRGAIRRVDSI